MKKIIEKIKNFIFGKPKPNIREQLLSQVNSLHNEISQLKATINTLAESLDKTYKEIYSNTDLTMLCYYFLEAMLREKSPEKLRELESKLIGHPNPKPKPPSKAN